MNESRYRVLLFVALALAAARFLIVPWIEHQGERRDALQVLTQRLDRSEGLVEARETILTQSTTLVAAARESRMRYPSAVSAEDYRLQAQQQFFNLAQDCGIVITVFDVLLEGEQKNANLGFVRVRLQIEGALNRIARFHGEVEGGLHNAAVRTVRVDSSFPIGEPGDPTVQASFTVDLYFSPLESVESAGAP